MKSNVNPVTAVIVVVVIIAIIAVIGMKVVGGKDGASDDAVPMGAGVEDPEMMESMGAGTASGAGGESTDAATQ